MESIITIKSDLKSIASCEHNVPELSPLSISNNIRYSEWDEREKSLSEEVLIPLLQGQVIPALRQASFLRARFCFDAIRLSFPCDERMLAHSQEQVYLV